MEQIKLLKDWGKKKAGEIINISKKGAEQFIASGAGEYLDTKKEIRKGIGKFIAKEYLNNATYNEIDDVVEKGNANSSRINFFFNKINLAEQFIKLQPIFYNSSKMWWVWNKEDLKWETRDETDILNLIGDNSSADTISSKEKQEILEALKQVSRKNAPKDLDIDCIQFKDQIINFKTEEMFQSTPKFFTTSPIPWDIGIFEDTPTMDKLFIDWVGKEYKDTLYETLAYCCSSNQFMQRLIALVGGGSNGKGTFIKLLKKFIGDENCVSSELDLLSSNQFETSSLYKKLVCEMGEVNKDDLKNSNQIKKLAGEDDIRYCFKGKTPFSEKSITTCIINTNNLPTTEDKTIGFYRRWLIIDFPNQFEVKSGIIESIPEIEFNNLAKKSISILKKLYKLQKFSNEGSYQERMDKYEERSNPIIRFIETNCEEEVGSYISLKKFSIEVNKYLKNKHLRVHTPKEIKKKLTEEGYEVSRTTKNYIKDFYIFNLNIKNYPDYPDYPNICKSILHVETSLKKLDNRDNVDKITFSDEEIKEAGYSKSEFEDLIKNIPLTE